MSAAQVPETRYVRSGGHDIAYQVCGEGDITFVGVPPVVSNIELMWEDHDMARFLRRQSTFARLVHFDKRGQGLSDRLAGVPTLEERVDDLAAVIDATGAERVVLGGVSEGGLMAAFYAAAHPDRVIGLELFGSSARFTSTDDYPIGPADQDALEFIDAWEASFGTAESLTPSLIAASKVGDAAFVRWLNRFERSSSTPSAFGATLRLDLQLDIRHVLNMIRVPTLVMHRTDDPLVPIAHGRYLAENIPGSRFVELAGADHSPWYGDQDAVLDELEAFVTGRRTGSVGDRVLATVLFTDIVDSTLRAAAVGDQPWARTLDDLDHIAARIVAEGRGRIVKSTGDGHLATFDGPARAIRAALQLAAEAGRLGIELRAGLHAGEIEIRGDDVGGIAVHIAARVAAAAGGSQVLVSRTVTDLVAGSGLTFTDAGAHALKGVDGTWQLFVAQP
ncbi:MAG: hypothetical protein QOE63_789 [Acidimicrobiaceae bacterium]